MVKKKAKINPKNYDDNCFQYSVTVALDHKKFEKKNHKAYRKLNLLSKIMNGKE